MQMPLEYILPLICSVMHATGMILCKRAFDGGVGIARTLVVFNWVQLLYFIPITLIYYEVPDWSQWHWPLLSGVLFFIGQLTTFAAVRVGDVSVQTPVMGTKMVFVAAFAALIGSEGIPRSWWIGAFLSMVGILLLGSGSLRAKGNLWLCIFYALLSAASFGLCDVIVAEYAQSFSVKMYPIVMMGVMAVLALVFVPFFREGFGAIQGSTWGWFLGAAFVLGFQGTLLYLTLSNFGKATAVNILYSSRAIWSVLLVWLFGHWVANRESQTAGPWVMFSRLIAAGLMLVAIFLVLTEPV